MRDLFDDIVTKAYLFAMDKHSDQKDDTGASYFHAHLCQVFRLVGEIRPCDKNMSCAALLHDTLEDTDTTYEELLRNFNRDIADLVLELTKDEDGTFSRLKSKRAILIKFADRLSNLSRMETWDDKRQNKYLEKSNFWRNYANT